MAPADHPFPALDQVIEAFVAEVRRGQNPAIDDYARRCPAYEREIRKLLPVVRLMEGCGRQLARATHRGQDALPWLRDYEVVREIGRGGMGIVYEARQASLARRVALKVLPAAASLRRELVERFRREALAAARLHHTNIVQVHGVGESDGQHFYVMQYIEGKSLAEFCACRMAHPAGLYNSEYDECGEPTSPLSAADRPLEPFRAVGRDWLRFVARVGLQAGEALAYAHAQGVLHRDVKPGNLLVDRQGRVWITDFGLAKITDLGDLTTTGDMPGTLRYLPPERLQGQADPQSDVFSLGLVLYELLAGRPAFDAADRAELLKQVSDASPPLLRRLAPGVPRDLETIVATCLEPDPARRYRTAQELADDCRRFIEDRPIATRRSWQVERLARWSRRNKLAAASLAAALVLLAALVSGSLWSAAYFHRQEGRQRTLTARAQTAAGEALAARARERGLLEEFRHNLYIAEMNLAGQVADSPGGGERIKELLVHWDPAIRGADEPDLRGWEWHYLDALCRDDGAPAAAYWGGLNALAYSPDGARLVSGGGDQTLRIWDAQSGRELKSWRAASDRLTAVAWSPDGRRIASASERTINLWDAAKGTRLRALEGHTQEVACVAWSSDGGRLASGSADSTIRIWDGDSGRELGVLGGHEKAVTALAWSPGGRELVSAAGDARVVIWDLATCAKRLDYRGHGGHQVTSLGWSPDGRRIASGSEAATIKVWEAATGADLATLRGHNGSVCSLAWDAEGARLVSASRYDWTIRVWAPVAGKELFALRVPSGGVSSVAWAPGGDRIASAASNGTIHLWDVASDGQPGAGRFHQDLVASLDWNPDDRRLASASWDGTTRIWSLDSDREDATLALPVRQRHAGVAWNPDGTLLAWGSDDGGVHLHDAETGETRELGRLEAGVRCVAWSPDGALVAAAGEGQLVRVWDAAAGELRATLVGNSSGVNALAWSPDGLQLASAGWDRNLRLWKAADFPQQVVSPAHNLAGHGDILRCVAWSSDGSRLASAGDDGAIKLWDAASGKLVLTLHGHTHAVHGVAWSPDGSRLASGSLDKTVRIWEPKRGLQLLTIRAGGYGVTAVAWSGEGTRIACATAAGAVQVLDASRDR